MYERSCLVIPSYQAPVARLTLRLCDLFAAIWLFSAGGIAQCISELQSGGPVATLRGRVLCSATWDPDGAGPLTTWLVVGGYDLTGGDQVNPVGLLAYDGAEWRGIGFDVNQIVSALTVFNGDLVAAGAFVLPTAAGAANRIARRNASSWQPLGTGMDDTVWAMTVFAGELVAGGQFGAAGGVPTGKIAKWSGTTWSALPGAPVFSADIRALASFGSLYVGGSFQTPVGNGLIRWTGTTWSSAGNPVNTATNFGYVESLTVHIGTAQGTSFLIAAGNFNNIGGTAVTNVARAGTGAATWSAMGAGLPQLGGIQLFKNVPFLGTPEVIATGIRDNASRVMRWNGSTWTALGNLGPAGAPAWATGPRIFGGYVAGLVDPAASLRAPSMFRFESDWTPLLGKGLSSPIQCLAVDGSAIIAGGGFAVVDGVTVNGIARRTGTTWSALGSGMTGGNQTVLAVVRAGNGDVFAGGSFTAAGGNATSNVARWNGSSWAPLGTGTDGTVRTLLLAGNGDLVAGGDFSTAGGVACNRIARWNGSAWSQMGTGMNDSVRCLATLATGEIIAGGLFQLAGGAICNRIALWNGATWSPLAGGMNGAVNALTLRPNGELVAGGAFTTASGIGRSRLARWDGVTWLPVGAGVPATVNALQALPDGDVLVGGQFATGAMNHLARWDSLVDQIGGVGSGLAGADVLAFAAASSGEVYIGGDFDAILPSRAAGHLAILTTNCPGLVYDNGPWVTHPATNASVLQDAAPYFFATLGFSVNHTPGFRLAEEFTVHTGLTITEIEVFHYSTNATTPNCTGVFLSLFQSNPNPTAGTNLLPGAGSSVNLLTDPAAIAAGFVVSNTMTGTYRVTPATMTSTARQIQSVRVTLPAPLPLAPGIYYLQWSITGTSVPFAPPITTLNVRNTGNGQQNSAGVWTTLNQTVVGTSTPVPGATQGAPFRLYGIGGQPGAIISLGGGCSTATFAVKGAPTIGGHLRVDLTNVNPQALGAVILGASSPNLPLPCACTLLASTDTVDPAGFFEVQVPVSAALVGTTLYTQGIELDFFQLASLPCNVGIGIALTDAYSFQLNVN